MFMASTQRAFPFHKAYHLLILTSPNSKKMYKKHIKAWGFEKNIKTPEMLAMFKISELRRSKNKDTRFIRRGRLVEPGTIRRFAKRHNLTAQGATGTLPDQQGTFHPRTEAILMH
jgi:hypothetical protein